jgi:hypothetical protein
MARIMEVMAILLRATVAKACKHLRPCWSLVAIFLGD